MTFPRPYTSPEPSSLSITLPWNVAKKGRLGNQTDGDLIRLSSHFPPHPVPLPGPIPPKEINHGLSVHKKGDYATTESDVVFISTAMNMIVIT